MNVASLELCRELYTVSEWDPHSDYGDWLPDKHGRYELRGGPWYNQYPRIPAYDLGYLLRHLPGGCSVEKSYNHADGTTYYAEYSNGLTFGLEDASTPEDAAAKLALHLFKQGILE